ncbi:MAG: hypothetical protein Q8830_03965, partial [Candidatus Phytoplasma australasiaticum]|nr:hypothetical protein [Candidatus Phytoplasma australasiaticum]
KIKSFNILLAGVNVDKEVILYNPNLSDLSLVNNNNNLTWGILAICLLDVFLYSGIGLTNRVHNQIQK